MLNKTHPHLAHASAHTPNVIEDLDLRADALNCAARIVAGSHEANVDKRAAQTLYIAEIFLDWLMHGEHPRTEGNLRRLYFIGHPAGNGNHPR